MTLKEPVAIIGIKKYNIDNDGIEKLEVQTSFYLSHLDPSTQRRYPVIVY